MKGISPLKVSLGVLAALFCLIGIFFYKALDVLLSVFPLDNPEALIFTLSHNVGGAQNVIWSLLKPVMTISIEFFIFTILAIGFVAFAFAFAFSKKTPTAIKNSIYHPFIILTLIAGLTSFSLAFFNFPFSSFVDSYGPILFGWSKENVLFDNDYVYPDSVHISFEHKRNLIIIFAESMEYNFQDSANGGNLAKNLIPEITDLMKKNISFKPGGITVNGTGWTMGEVVAKLCGLPLMIPLDGHTYGKKNFLKNASCLTDLLNKNGHSVILAQGSGIQFASMDHFLSTHSVPQSNFFDLDYFEKKGAKSTDSLFFSSIPDQILYDEMKELTSQLSSQTTPWALIFFTIDTHGPFGRLSTNCIDANAHLKIEQQYPSIIRCASKQLNDFLEWASTQPWYNETTIVVMGDHPAMINPETAGLPKDKIERYWLNIFINSTLPAPKAKQAFTSFDMFPTILEAMGARIDGHALGLGRSLFSNQETLLEKYGKDSLNVLINRKGDSYNHFWR